MLFGRVKVELLEANRLWTDGGSTMGLLPKTTWEKSFKADSRNRIATTTRCLLIIDEHKRIIVDTGIGNRFDEKTKEIFSVGPFNLINNLKYIGIKREDIDFVILSHLHFDHCGGVVSNINGVNCLTFPNAKHIIQNREWVMAKSPDGLNKYAYDFSFHLSFLEEKGKVVLLDGDINITKNVSVRLSGGHSIGHQIVEIKNGGKLGIYAGDLVSNNLHLRPHIISAFDINRQKSFIFKTTIFQQLAENNGVLFFDHELEKSYFQF